MDDGSVFFEVELLRADGSRPVMSAAALEIHVRVIHHLAHRQRHHHAALQHPDRMLEQPHILRRIARDRDDIAVVARRELADIVRAIAVQ